MRSQCWKQFWSEMTHNLFPMIFKLYPGIQALERLKAQKILEKNHETQTKQYMPYCLANRCKNPGEKEHSSGIPASTHNFRKTSFTSPKYLQPKVPCRWRWLSFGKLCVVWYILNDVSETLIASIIRALRSISQYLSDYTAKHPIKEPSSHSSPWEPEIFPAALKTITSQLILLSNGTLHAIVQRTFSL